MQKHRHAKTVAPACAAQATVGEEEKNSMKNDR